jgi:hypothetical protein
MGEIQHGLELSKLIEERGEEPVQVAHGCGVPTDSDGFTLFRFSDGTEVIETNAGIVSDDAGDDFLSLKHMCGG